MPRASPERRDGKRISAYVALLIALWMAAMTARLYPDLSTAVRVDGRVTSIDAFIDDSCTARIGPAAETCLDEARGEAQILLHREQAKSILLILAPAVLYLLYLPLVNATRRVASRLGRGARQNE
jgi:hypothetical protein